jgi:SAM-dependent methyltransferase
VESTLDRVKQLYESYPYPPLQERLGFPLLAALDHIRCVLWPRRPSLKGLRVLDAGCGTGNVAVELASRYPDVEVVGVDVSRASLEIARRRAERAGVGGNLRFHQGTVEGLVELDLGEQPFDYIVSSGVLHHLADPQAGARQLSARLAPDGVLGLMVYAPHGRHGVYVLQELLRRVAGSRPMPEQIAIARSVLAALPADHPFRAKEFADQDWSDDAGIVDLLLHVRDRSYTVPELRELLGHAGLRIARFVLPHLYRPETYLGQPALGFTDAQDPATLAELVCGTMRMHVAIACHADFEPRVVSPEESGARPIRSPLLRWSDRTTVRTSRGKGRGSDLGIQVSEMSYSSRVRDLALDGESARFLESCDGEKTLLEVFREPAMFDALAGTTEADKRRRYRDLISAMLAGDLVYLLGS